MALSLSALVGDAAYRYSFNGDSLNFDCLIPGVKGDLVVQLVPEPLPALSMVSQDQELEVSLDEVATQGPVPKQHDAEREAGCTEEEASAQGEEKPQIHIHLL